MPKIFCRSTRVVRDAAIAAGAPENCIQWIEHPSIEATSMLMNHPGIAIVLATGGAEWSSLLTLQENQL